MRKQFPNDFLWGTATASYQIEGACNEDGRTPSIWDTFSKTKGKVFKGHTGDIACDHYHRYIDDAKLIAELGCKSYRFSISWTRIFPERGKINPKGLAFYRNLLQELHKHNIVPVVTIYHWDLPQYLQDQGGWASRDTVEAYFEYASVLFQEFGEIVPMWITHNEPWCAAFLGYGIGYHAPGHKSLKEAAAASHHILLSHGRAVQLYRSLGLKGQIGITLNLTPAIPASDRQEDKEAAHRIDGFSNRWFLDPLFKTSYPSDMIHIFESYTKKPLDIFKTGDLGVISTPMDFLGVNFYTRNVVKKAIGNPLHARQVTGGNEVTDMGWEIVPEHLYHLLTRLKKEYTILPLYITENGAAFPDKVVNGEVNDAKRIEYLKSHFEQAYRFIAEGGNLKGYFVWSLLDNYEWAFGYSKRFGIVFVDYNTQQRIPKKSAKWYAQVIKQNGI